MAALLAMRWFDPSALSGLALISLSLGVLAFFVYGLVKGFAAARLYRRLSLVRLASRCFIFWNTDCSLGIGFSTQSRSHGLRRGLRRELTVSHFGVRSGQGAAEQNNEAQSYSISWGTLFFWSVFWRFLCWLEKRELATVQLRVPCCFRAFIFWNTLCLPQLSSLRVQAGERQRCSVDGVEVNSLHIASGGISR